VTGGIIHPCARCGEPTERIPVGGWCAACTRVVDRRAARVSRWVALGTTVLVAAYFAARLRSVPPPWVDRSRVVGAVAIVAWYWLTFRIAKRIALEWLE
jgi:hypothetical protein